MKKRIIFAVSVFILVVGMILFTKLDKVSTETGEGELSNCDLVVLELVGNEAFQKLGYLSSGSEPIDLSLYDNDFEKLKLISDETNCFNLISNRTYTYLPVEDYDGAIHDFILEDKIKYTQYGYYTRTSDDDGAYEPIYFAINSDTVIHTKLPNGTYREFNAETDLDVTKIYYGLPYTEIDEDGNELIKYKYILKDIVDSSYDSESGNYNYILGFDKIEDGTWKFVPAFLGRLYQFDGTSYVYKEDIKSDKFSEWFRLRESFIDNGTDVKVKLPRAVVELDVTESTKVTNKNNFIRLAEMQSYAFVTKRYDEVTVDDLLYADIVYFNTESDKTKPLVGLYLEENGITEELDVCSANDLSTEVCDLIFNKLVSQSIIAIYDSNLLGITGADSLTPVGSLYVSSIMTYPTIANKCNIYENSRGISLAQLRSNLTETLGVHTDLHLLGIDNYAMSNEYICKHNILAINNLGVSKDILKDFDTEFMSKSAGVDEVYSTLSLEDSDNFSIYEGLRYLLYNQKTVSLSTDCMKILEIQPCNSFYNDDYWSLRMSGIDPYYTGDVNVTRYQAKAFNGYKGNLYSDFDTVFIGSNHDILAHTYVSEVYFNNTVEIAEGDTKSVLISDYFVNDVDLSTLVVRDLVVSDETIAEVEYNPIDNMLTFGGLSGGLTKVNMFVNDIELEIRIAVTNDLYFTLHSGDLIVAPYVHAYDTPPEVEGCTFTHEGYFVSGRYWTFPMVKDRIDKLVDGGVQIDVSENNFEVYSTNTFRLTNRYSYKNNETGALSDIRVTLYYNFMTIPEQYTFYESTTKVPTIYNDESLNGKLYLHIGDIIDASTYNQYTNFSGILYSPTADGFAQIYNKEYLKVRLSGSDITKLKADELKDFANAGKLVLVDSIFYKENGIDIDESVFDTTSNMYKFLKSGVPIYNNDVIVNYDYSKFLENGFSVTFDSVPRPYIDIVGNLEKVDSVNKLIVVNEYREEYFQKKSYTYDELNYRDYKLTGHQYTVNCPTGYSLNITQYTDSGILLTNGKYGNGTTFKLRDDTWGISIYISGGSSFDSYKNLLQSGSTFSFTAKSTNPSKTPLDDLLINSVDQIELGTWDNMYRILPYNNKCAAYNTLLVMEETCSLSYKSMFTLRDDKLQYKFTINQESDSYDGYYTLNLYSDVVSDGNFNSDEKMYGVYITDPDGKVVPETKLKAGITYTATKPIDDSVKGMIHWLFRINRNDNEGYVKDYQGYSCRASNTERPIVYTLQILPISGNLFDMETDESFLGYVDNIEDFKIEIVSLSQDELVDSTTGLVKDIIYRDGDLALGFQDFNMVVLGFAAEANYITNEDLITQLQMFIESGKSVLFSHDTLSYHNSMKDSSNYYNNKYFRQILGQDRFGVTMRTSNVVFEDLGTSNDSLVIMDEDVMNSEAGLTRFTSRAIQHGFDRAELNGVYDYRALYGLNEGFLLSAADNRYYNFFVYDPVSVFCMTDEFDGKNVGSVKKARCLNVGQISMYPYYIGDIINVSTTHSQFYELNMEDDEITVWYTLHQPTWSNKVDRYTTPANYAYLNDLNASNTYYIYTKGNITYCGLGHWKPTDLERRLYVNTLVMAYRPSATTPKIIVTNENAENVGDLSCVYVDYDVFTPDTPLDVEEYMGDFNLRFKVLATSIAQNTVNGIYFSDKNTGGIIPMQCYSTDTNELLPIVERDGIEMFVLDNSTEFYMEININSLNPIYGDSFSADSFNIPIECNLVTTYGVDEIAVDSVHTLRLIKRGLFNLH